jgi:hypothetical protein
MKAPQTTKQIKFDTVEIREYPIVLSTNPACEYGPSIEIGWEYDTNADKAITVSQYEKERIGKRKREKPGRPSQLYLSQVRREAILKEAGYTEEEVKTAVRGKRKARMQRSMSTFLSVWTRINATAKGIKKERKVMRAVRNLEKLQNNRKGEPSTDLFCDNASVYKGWWMPFSAYIF